MPSRVSSFVFLMPLTVIDLLDALMASPSQKESTRRVCESHAGDLCAARDESPASVRWITSGLASAILSGE
jgi:hypothetical protein